VQHSHADVAMSRLRNQDGFTLMEVLMAVTVGFVVLAATLGLLESSVRLDAGVMSKTDAMQRGRLAMDTLTQELRSQVCLDFDNPAVLSGAGDNSITFYGDYSAAGQRPFKREIVFNPTNSTITSYRYDAAAGATLPLKPDSFPSSPTVTRQVLEGARNQVDTALGTIVPFLRYYANQKDADGVYRPSEKLAVPLSADDAKRVARIEISFLARPTGARDDKQAVNLTDQIMARHLDPNVSLNPKCV
jgi:prepilin-type N-terminal cleavage/methylation domain-containing protein